MMKVTAMPSESLDAPIVVAAGRGKSMALEPIARKIIELTKKRHPTILYLGTASYDRETPFLAQTKGLREASCKIMKLDLSRNSSKRGSNGGVPPRHCILETFEKADALLTSGGNTRYAVRRWKELGVDEIIRNAAFRKERPLVLCGGSAGAVCYFSHGHSDSNDPCNVANPDPNMTEEEKCNWDYIRVPGMNIIPALCVPHHDITPSNGKPRSLDSNKMVMRHPQEPAIGIDEKAALVMVGDQISVVSADGKAKCYAKVCHQDGDDKRLKVNVIDESDGEMSFSDLLECIEQ